MSAIASPPARLRHSVPEAAQLLSISPRQIWRLISDGRLHPVREGRRTFLSRAELERVATSGVQ